MSPSCSEYSSQSQPSDNSAAIAQVDSIIHRRMSTHFFNFTKKSSDYWQHGMHICENLGKLNFMNFLKYNSKEISLQNLGSRADYLIADDTLYTHVWGIFTESYSKNRLSEPDFSTNSSNTLNWEDSNYKNWAGYGSYYGEPQCDNLTNSWSQHCGMNSVGDISPFILSNLFPSGYHNQSWSLNTNTLCNGSISYPSLGFIEAINPVLNVSVLYSNRTSTERHLVNNYLVFYHLSVNTNPECNCSMVYSDRASSLVNSVYDISVKYPNRGPSVENPICINPRSYVDRCFGVQNSVCKELICYSNRGLRAENPLYNGSILYPNQDLIVNNKFCNGLMFRDEIRALLNGRGLTNRVEFNYYSCTESFILQGRGLVCVAEKRRSENGKGSRGRKKKSKTKCVSQIGRGKSMTRNIQSLMLKNQMVWQTMGCSVFEFRGYVYLIARDQIGCRFLQRVLEKGNHQDIQIIFNEMIICVTELITDPFANHLIQKLLGMCNEEQITEIVFMVTAKKRRFVEICFNKHGTCVVQKLMKNLKTRQQKIMVVSALETRFLELAKDENGYHVIKSCLQFLSKKYTKFIFDAAAKCHVGCCILKSCISQSVGRFREKLVTEIACEGFDLAQDAFGNYVIQYIIELNMPSAAAILNSQFRGNYVYLSIQKFSSYVVQTFFNSYEKSRPIIIQEFLSVPQFNKLLQDPFANYVIQTAVDVSKGRLHDLLVEAIRSHSTRLSSVYRKKFLLNLLKK